jgi:hypothetical protein
MRQFLFMVAVERAARSFGVTPKYGLFVADAERRNVAAGLQA